MDVRIITYPNSEFAFKNGSSLVPGVEYVCFGIQRTSFFEVKKYSPLYSLNFSVKKIIYHNKKNNMCGLLANVLLYQNGKEIPHVKNLMAEGIFYNIYKEAEYESEGYWETYNGKREVFVIVKHSELLTSTERQIFNYLKFITKGKRFGDKKINGIISRFGENSIESIKKNDPDYIAIVKNVKLANAVRKIVTDNKTQEDAFYYMIQNDISSEAAVKVLEKYHSLSMIAIRNNPYILTDFNIPLKTIDSIAKKESVLFDDPKRIKAFIMSFIQEKVKQNGDLYVCLDDLIDGNENGISPLNEFIINNGNMPGDILNKKIGEAVDDLASKNKIQIVKDKTKTYIYKTYYLKAEDKIVEKIKDMLSSPSHLYMSKKEILDNINLNKTIKLDAKQKQAVIMAVQNKLSIITGGPGTGKTQTISMIVDILSNNFDLDIQLCAPTGKASRKMSEVMHMKAETIHKKLNYFPGSIQNEKDLNNITCDYLIIDESSMIDIDLFYKLLIHISDKTSLLLVGDYNQIPSVGPGLILRDLIESKKIPCVELTKNFRQKGTSGIIVASHYILNGNVDNIIKKKNFKDFKLIAEKTDEDTYDKIMSLVRNAVARKKITVYNLQILTPLNDGMLGTMGLNKGIQDIINPPDKTKNEIFVSSVKIFRENDKVIQTRNNYDLNVFNGSIGYIENINTSRHELIVNFDGNSVKYKAAEMNELNLAYAITIHKSQGSEFDYIIMPLSLNHSVVNNKNLVYTAITRAKKQAILIGSEEELIYASGKTADYSRRSNIKDKLIKIL